MSMDSLVGNKKIASVSVARSDIGRMKSLYHKLSNIEGIDFELVNFISVELFKNDIDFSNLINFERSELIIDKDLDVIKKSAFIVDKMGQYLSANNPDCLLVLGDRFEMLAVAQAALLLNIPIIHIGGGYETLGAFDDSVRKAISNLSEIHLVANDKCKQNLLSLGVDKNKIFLTGAPDIEQILLSEIKSIDQIRNEFKIKINNDFILATFHPETKASVIETKKSLDVLWQLLSTYKDLDILITGPCEDPGADKIIEIIERSTRVNNRIFYVESLGYSNYISAMFHAKIVMGNSSSGIIEIGSFTTFGLNVGNRQKGRQEPYNTITCNYNYKEIVQLLSKYNSRENKKEIVHKNIYGDGNFSSYAIDIIENFLFGEF